VLQHILVTITQEQLMKLKPIAKKIKYMFSILSKNKTQKKKNKMDGKILAKRSKRFHLNLSWELYALMGT